MYTAYAVTALMCPRTGRLLQSLLLSRKSFPIYFRILSHIEILLTTSIQRTYRVGPLPVVRRGQMR